MQGKGSAWKPFHLESGTIALHTEDQCSLFIIFFNMVSKPREWTKTPLKEHKIYWGERFDENKAVETSSELLTVFSAGLRCVNSLWLWKHFILSLSQRQSNWKKHKTAKLPGGAINAKYQPWLTLSWLSSACTTSKNKKCSREHNCGNNLTADCFKWRQTWIDET